MSQLLVEVEYVVWRDTGLKIFYIITTGFIISEYNYHTHPQRRGLEEFLEKGGAGSELFTAISALDGVSFVLVSPCNLNVEITDGRKWKRVKKQILSILVERFGSLNIEDKAKRIL